jgi:formamidopyrimidine-DNA glycosylase
MPELPEVETIRRDLLRTIKGLSFQNVRIVDRRVVRAIASSVFVKRLTGRSILDVQRRGKALLLQLGGLWLVVQPMMTGQLVAIPPGRDFQLTKDAKVIFTLSKGWRLIYNDQRLFGRLHLVKDPFDLAYVRELGPEPLDAAFISDQFSRRLENRKTAIKTLLLNSKFIAGIGNIYAAEALFLAGIDPRRKAQRLKSAEVKRLHQAIRDVLSQAVELRGTSIRNYRDGQGEEGKYRQLIQVYGREGEPCRVCREPVRRIVQAQRSTFFCRKCQK